jgi:outer membrane protein assembly factor BamB
LGDRYFLGPPLPLDGRLYGLTEKDNLLALNCLDAADGRPLWQQPLAYAPSRLLLDPGRHIQAASPVYGHGVLVCPTNTGVVLGIDLLTPGLAWAYPYRSRTLTYSRATAGGRRPRISPPQVVAEWKSPVTLIDQDRVLFTAPDEASIHCLNLRDGTLVWRRDRDRDDLYLAGVVAGHALVVGNHGCRALALEDGQQRWRVETGVPTGRGAAAGDRYYLPVRAAGSKKQPTIVVIDARRGTVLARVRVAGKQAPGNLVVCGDEILSQSVTALTAYRAKKAAKK